MSCLVWGMNSSSSISAASILLRNWSIRPTDNFLFVVIACCLTVSSIFIGGGVMLALRYCHLAGIESIRWAIRMWPVVCPPPLALPPMQSYGQIKLSCNLISESWNQLQTHPCIRKKKMVEIVGVVKICINLCQLLISNRNCDAPWN